MCDRSSSSNNFNVTLVLQQIVQLLEHIPGRGSKATSTNVDYTVEDDINYVNSTTDYTELQLPCNAAVEISENDVSILSYMEEMLQNFVRDNLNDTGTNLPFQKHDYGYDFSMNGYQEGPNGTRIPYEANGPTPAGNGGIHNGNFSDTTDIQTLPKMEIVKVVVLIVVISIILITTCRMLFQIFSRITPAKNNNP